MAVRVFAHVRVNGRCPYEDFLAQVEASGDQDGHAKIEAYVQKLGERGHSLALEGRLAENLKGESGLCELKPKPYRVFYYHDEKEQAYVLLNGYRKRSNDTPKGVMREAKRLMTEHRNWTKGGKNAPQ